MTTADGRSPGSRVVTLRRLPRTEIPVAYDEGFAAYSCGGSRGIGELPRTAFLLIPKTGTVGNYGRSLSKFGVNPPRARCAVLTGRVRYFCRMSTGRPEIGYQHGTKFFGDWSMSAPVCPCDGRDRSSGRRASAHLGACRAGGAAGADFARHRPGAAVASGRCWKPCSAAAAMYPR